MPFPDPFYRWRPHPWHGLEVGPDPPGLVHAAPAPRLARMMSGLLGDDPLHSFARAPGAVRVRPPRLQAGLGHLARRTPVIAEAPILVEADG